MFLKTVIPMLILPASMAFAANRNQCLQNLKTPHLAMYQMTTLNSNELIASVGNTCVELDNKEMYSGKSIFESAADSASYMVSGLDMIFVAEGFSEGPAGDQHQAFSRQLEVIRANPDRMQRIQAVYRLVSEFQAKSKTSADEKGLLYWALGQVAKHPSSKTMTFSESDFSVSYELGKVISKDEELVSHSWVRVHLPYVKTVENKISVQFFDFDLDSSWYGGQFTMITPRRVELNNKQRQFAVKECAAVVQCLQDGTPILANKFLKAGKFPRQGSL